MNTFKHLKFKRRLSSLLLVCHLLVLISLLFVCSFLLIDNQVSTPLKQSLVFLMMKVVTTMGKISLT